MVRLLGTITRKHIGIRKGSTGNSVNEGSWADVLLYKYGMSNLLLQAVRSSPRPALYGALRKGPGKEARKTEILQRYIQNASRYLIHDLCCIFPARGHRV